MADPDLQIGRPGYLDSVITGGSASKKFFRPFGSHFGLRLGGGGGGGGGAPLDPSLHSLGSSVFYILIL